MGLDVKVKSEVPCSNCGYMRKNLMEFQEKNSRLKKILKLREEELELLKKENSEVVLIE